VNLPVRFSLEKSGSENLERPLTQMNFGGELAKEEPQSQFVRRCVGLVLYQGALIHIDFRHEAEYAWGRNGSR
jgi:hypothetical protein